MVLLSGFSNASNSSSLKAPRGIFNYQIAVYDGAICHRLWIRSERYRELQLNHLQNDEFAVIIFVHAGDEFCSLTDATVVGVFTVKVTSLCEYAASSHTDILGLLHFCTDGPTEFARALSVRKHPHIYRWQSFAHRCVRRLIFQKFAIFMFYF